VDTTVAACPPEVISPHSEALGPGHREIRSNLGACFFFIAFFSPCTRTSTQRYLQPPFGANVYKWALCTTTSF
jgi:hypothetical protein